MTGVDLSLLAGLIIALALSLGDKRAWGWLLAAAASYVVSVIYWRTGLPYGAFVAGMGDALVCLAVYLWGSQKWEMGVWRLFQFSALVNIVYLGGELGAPAWASQMHNGYSIILEAVNWTALLWIGGNGAFQPAGDSDARAAPTGLMQRFRRVMLALHRPRADAPFHKAVH